MNTRTRTRIAGVFAAGASLAMLSGCWIDAALWGADGARVIDTTKQLIAAESTADQDALACEDFSAGFGDAEAWNGLSAGEPEKYNADTSFDRRLLEHQPSKDGAKLAT